MFAYWDDQDCGQDTGFDAPSLGGSLEMSFSRNKYGNSGEKLVKKKKNLDEMPKSEKNFYQEHTNSYVRKINLRRTT
uniref:Uncharacterized protein n=1 Tax=Equus asinus TaxID=9793 RepID=A0A8C4MCI3_EQUAS